MFFRVLLACRRATTLRSMSYASVYRCICLASKKQVQCSPVGGGQLVPALISIDSIPAEFQMNPGRRGLQIRNSHGLCFSVAVEPQSQQMFYSGRVCLFRFQKVF